MRLSLHEVLLILCVFLSLAFFVKVSADKIDNYEFNLVKGGVLMNVDSEKNG